MLKKNFLVTWAALVLFVVGSVSPAFAVDAEMQANAAPGTDLSSLAAGDDITDKADGGADNAADFGQINVNGGGKTANAIDIDKVGTATEANLLILDSDDTDNGELLTVTTFVDIVADKTLIITFDDADLTVNQTLGEGGADAENLTRGGSLTLKTAAPDDNTNVTSEILIKGSTLLTDVVVEGGTGGGAADQIGHHIEATFGAADAETTFNVKGLTVTGGAAGGTDAAGADATATVNGTATIEGAKGLTVTGGAGAADATSPGGAATLTFNEEVTVTGGDVAVTGGAAAAHADGIGGGATLTFKKNFTTDAAVIATGGAGSPDAAGGDALLVFEGNVESTGNLQLTGGANATEPAGDARATFKGDVTFTGIDLDEGDSGPNDGDAALVFSGTEAQTVTGAVSTPGGEGTISVHNAKGVTFVNAVGADGAVLRGITIGAVNSAGAPAAGASSATFQADVYAPITLAGTDAAETENTVTFDSTSADLTYTGTLEASHENAINNVVVTGDNTVTFASALADAEIDKVTVSGGTLHLDAAISGVASIAVEEGAVLEQDGGDITADIENNGTVKVITAARTIDGDISGDGTLDIDAAVTIEGDISGDGTLDIDAATTVTGTIAAKTADIAAFTLTHNTGTTYKVGTTNFSADGILDFANARAITVTGDFTTATDNEGTIKITDGAFTTAFVGNIGADGKELKSLEIAAGGSISALTTTGNLYVKAITLDEADTLTFLGEAAQTVSGTITSRTDEKGTITVGDGTKASDVTFKGALGGAVNNLLAMTVKAKSSAAFRDDAAFAGAFVNEGTTHIAAGKTVTAATYTPNASGAGGTFVVGVKRTDASVTTSDKGTTAGKLVLTGGAANLEHDTVKVSIEDGSLPLAEATVQGVFAGNAPPTLPKVEDELYLFDFTLEADSNTPNEGNLKITQANTVSGAVPKGLAAAGEALLSGDVATGNADAVTAELVELRALVQNQPDATSLANVVEALASPNLDGSAALAAQTVTNTVTGLTDRRLAALRSGSGFAAAGDYTRDVRAWGKVFGSTGEQDKREGISGYDVDTFGAALGIDRELRMGQVVGFAFAYSDTDVESKGLSKAKTDIEAYQFSFYGDYRMENDMQLSAQLGYAMSENETTRFVAGNAARVAKGTFDASQFFVRVKGGKDFHMPSGIVTPGLSLQYSLFDADGYTEKGAGGASLKVTQDKLDKLELGLDVAARWKIEQPNGGGASFEPSLHAGVRYDLMDEKVSGTNAYTGGGAAFRTEGFKPARTTFNLGAGVTYFAVRNWEYSVEYDFETREDYTSHGAYLKAAYRF